MVSKSVIFLVIIIIACFLDLFCLASWVALLIFDPYLHFSTTKKHCSSKINVSRYELCKAYHNNVRFAEIEPTWSKKIAYADNSQSFLLMLRDNENMRKIPVDMNGIIYYKYFFFFALLTRILTIIIFAKSSQLLYLGIPLILYILYMFFVLFSLKSFYRTDSVRILLNNHVEYKTNTQKRFYMIDYNFTTIGEFLKFSKSKDFENFSGMEEQYIDYVRYNTFSYIMLIPLVQMMNMSLKCIIIGEELRVGSE